MPLTNIRQEEVGNLLIASLPPEEFGRLAPGLARVELRAGRRLYDLEGAIRNVHFPEGGLFSLLSTLGDGASVEVAALGREGLGGLPVLLGSDAAVHTAAVQVGGAALRLKTERARECLGQLPAFRAAVLRYARLLLAQVTRTTLCNTLHTVEQRLARWILLGRMRLGSDTLPVTHEHLSQMLGVRRSGVTVAVGALERAGLVTRGRGALTVAEPAGLKRVCCGCAAGLTDEYDSYINDLGVR
ncbi:MAG TPA: Crp/Fnr family transcriptional regulator [Pyrinomonadaceae bacterium]|jgi:CRP-like cAMP-binding protein